MDARTTLVLLSAHLLLSGFLFSRFAAGIAAREGLEDWSFGSLAGGVALLLRIPGTEPLHMASDLLLIGGALLFLRGVHSFVRPAPPRAISQERRRFATVWVGLALLSIPLTLAGMGDLFLEGTLGLLLLATGWSTWRAAGAPGGTASPSFVTPLKGLGVVFSLLGLGSLLMALSPALEARGIRFPGPIEAVIGPLLASLVFSVAFALVWLVFSRMHGRMEGLASEDPLTEILNRRGLQQTLKRHFERRTSEPVVFLLGDLDYFKSVNDRFGHEGGDEVLRQVAAILKIVVRRGDFVARFGGEEFLIGCVDATPELGLRLADRIRSEVAGLRIDVGNDEWVRCTISIGVSEPFRRPDLWRRALAQADRAMYEAKALGRDRSVAFRDLPPEEQTAADTTLTSGMGTSISAS